MSPLANVLLTALSLWAVGALLVGTMSFLGWRDADRQKDRRSFARQFRRAGLWPYDGCRAVVRVLREILAEGRETG